MKKLNLLAGITAVLFLAVSALPAYSAKGGNSDWPEGKDFASWDGTLDEETPCVAPSPDGQNAYDLYTDAERAVNHLNFEESGNPKQRGPYPMPPNQGYDSDTTTAKDEASAAWQLYNSKYDYSKGKDVRAKIYDVLSKFEINTTVEVVDDEEVRVGGRWTDSSVQDPTLDDIHTTFTNLYICVGGTVE